MKMYLTLDDYLKALAVKEKAELEFIDLIYLERYKDAIEEIRKSL